jgi:hypothetical protein
MSVVTVVVDLRQSKLYPLWAEKQTPVRVCRKEIVHMFEFTLEYSHNRRYVRYKASYPALPAECRIREPVQ